MDYSLLNSRNFQPTLNCVLFPKKDKAEKTKKGSEDGIKSFCKASRIRKDNVFDRLEEYIYGVF